MAVLGSSFTLLSLVVSAISVIAGIWGIYKKDTRLILISRQGLYLNLIAIIASVLVLIYLLVLPDFSVMYVVNHISTNLPIFYKITGLWAGAEGSILFWSMLLSVFSAIAIKSVEKQEPVILPYMVIVLMSISFFFAILLNFSVDSDPFKVLKQGEMVMTSNEGRGLNPLLQHWAMVIHPPILFLGYVSFAVPYAIAISSLLAGRMNLQWTRLVRRWTLFSWASLGVGIMLGGKWAYEELGWGGYWAWDPVENASLIPWLTGTAFLHSILVQEKRGMLKVWNMVLVTISFFMCIFGTFLTRSGIVQSVHSFANTDIAPFFVWFMLMIILFSGYLVFLKYSSLRSDRPMNSYLSREAGFLFNNVLLLIMVFTILWGTLYPTISEYFFNERVSVTIVWFNQIMAPMGLVLLFLTGAGPLLAWRTTSAQTLWKNFRLPVASFVITLVIYSVYHLVLDGKKAADISWMGGISFSLSAFLVTGVLEEYIRTLLTRKRFTGESLIPAMILVLFQNKRRYLGYAVHLGLALMYIGFTGKAFTYEGRLTMKPGVTEYFQGYMIEVEKAGQFAVPEGARVPRYITSMVWMKVYDGKKLLGEDTTEVRSYPIFNLSTGKYDRNQETSEPAIITTASKDIYLQYAGMDEEENLILQVWINPLVNWVWGGFIWYNFFLIFLLLPIGEKKELSLLGKKYQIAASMGR